MSGVAAYRYVSSCLFAGLVAIILTACSEDLSDENLQSSALEQSFSSVDLQELNNLVDAEQEGGWLLRNLPREDVMQIITDNGWEEQKSGIHIGTNNYLNNCVYTASKLNLSYSKYTMDKPSKDMRLYVDFTRCVSASEFPKNDNLIEVRITEK